VVKEFSRRQNNWNQISPKSTMFLADLVLASAARMSEFQPLDFLKRSKALAHNQIVAL
jgi:hypothetical protein